MGLHFLAPVRNPHRILSLIANLMKDHRRRLNSLCLLLFLYRRMCLLHIILSGLKHLLMMLPQLLKLIQHLLLLPEVSIRI
uniref:Uncharacterized protein n=1 Tax=Brassica oleracea TaxID=3712 RepID=A0A3P6CCD8_BRAOL|nr:unnamed protein product [Brassica oleracea]